MTMYLHCIIGDLSMRLAGVAALGLVLLQHILPLCPPCNTIPVVYGHHRRRYCRMNQRWRARPRWTPCCKTNNFLSDVCDRLLQAQEYAKCHYDANHRLLECGSAFCNGRRSHRCQAPAKS
jgi:hypothetical protein